MNTIIAAAAYLLLGQPGTNNPVDVNVPVIDCPAPADMHPTKPNHLTVRWIGGHVKRHLARRRHHHAHHPQGSLY